MIDDLTIRIDPQADYRGNHKVVLDFREHRLRDKFDVDSDHFREIWLDKVVPKIAKCLGPEYKPSISFENASYDPDATLREAIRQKLADAIESSATDKQPLWTPQIRLASTITPTKAEWVWDGWLPACAISVCDGDPGLGKSQLSLDIAAHLTRGDAMPSGMETVVSKPANVMVTNGEDDEARVLVPRLLAAGAEMGRVHLFRTMGDGEDERQLTLPSDLPAIEAYIMAHSICLWVIDPFVMFLDSQLSVNNDADVRRCLGQLSAMAERTRVAILLVRHLNKKSGSHAIYRGGGSIGITGAARSVFMVGLDPDDDQCRIVASVKSNLCEAPQSLRFHIKSVDDTSRVAWNGGNCDLLAHDLLGERKSSRTNKKELAEGIMAELLANGPRGESEILAEMEKADIGRSTYWRARRELGVVSEKTGYQGLWMLSLPSTNGHYAEFDDEF